MPIMRFLISIFTAGLVLLAGQLHAAIKIKGSVRYQFASGNKSVSFGADRIENDSTSVSTGTLMVQLWALNAPHNGGTLSGKVVASYKLDPLLPGNGYPKVNKTVSTTMPGTKKSYHMCLVVAEYRSSGYVTADYRNFSSPAVLGPLPLFTLAGPWKWQTHVQEGTIDISVGKISHNRNGSTGSLKLSAWATSGPYRGGNLQGYQLGLINKAALKQGYSYPSVQGTTKYTAPPPGNYYVSIILSEYSGDSYKVVGWLTGGSPSAFK